MTPTSLNTISMTISTCNIVDKKGENKTQQLYIQNLYIFSFKKEEKKCRPPQVFMLGVARCQEFRSLYQRFTLKGTHFLPSVLLYLCNLATIRTRSLYTVEKAQMSWKHWQMFKLEFNDLHWDILLKLMCNRVSLCSFRRPFAATKSARPSQWGTAINPNMDVVA